MVGKREAKAVEIDISGWEKVQNVVGKRETKIKLKTGVQWGYQTIAGQKTNKKQNQTCNKLN